MARMTPWNRLEPSLLDRLTDTRPLETKESDSISRITSKRLRELVTRDLSWLLNATHFESNNDLSAGGHIANSVVNFGIPDLSGRMLSDLPRQEMEQALAKAITRFEPRIAAKTLRVRLVSTAKHRGENSLVFIIEGELWARPTPTQLHIQSRVDLEDGNITFVDGVPRGEI